MQVDLRSLSNIAGRGVAVEVAVARLRDIAATTFSEALLALDSDTLQRQPARFYAATRAVQQAIEAMRSAEAGE